MEDVVIGDELTLCPLASKFCRKSLPNDASREIFRCSHKNVELQRLSQVKGIWSFSMLSLAHAQCAAHDHPRIVSLGCLEAIIRAWEACQRRRMMPTALSRLRSLWKRSRARQLIS